MKKLLIPITLLLITGCATPEWKIKQDKAIKKSDTTIYINGRYETAYYTKRKTIEFPSSGCIQFTELENLSTIYACAQYRVVYKQQY